MRSFICDNCDEVDEASTRVEDREEVYNVKEEARVTVLAKVRICRQCGKDISDEQLDEETLRAAYALHAEGRTSYKGLST